MLKDKVIVVTGGAGLLGENFVKAIKAQNGIPVIADINSENGNVVAGNVDCDFIHLDISSKESICNLINTLDKKYGHIDGIINNAYPRNQNYGRMFRTG